jgi:hypothetical protein
MSKSFLRGGLNKGRLANSRGGFITRLPDLDRGPGFLGQRCRYLDYGTESSCIYVES